MKFGDLSLAGRSITYRGGNGEANTVTDLRSIDNDKYRKHDILQ